MQNQAMTCLICCRQRYDSRPQCGSVCSLCHQLLQGWANGAAGSSCLAHLLSACWASSSLAASNEKAAALRVSSPQYFQESSVKSPYRLALQALRKLSRRTDRRARVVTLAGGFFSPPCLFCNSYIRFSQKTSSVIPVSGHFIRGSMRAKMKRTFLLCPLAYDQRLSFLLRLISWFGVPQSDPC